jgi:Tfp pilus assembly protein PilX
MKHKRHLLRKPQREQGVALVLTLLIVAMLVVVVVGFTTAARTEQAAARNATYRVLSEQLAQEATAQGMQRLVQAFGTATVPGFVATQPGRIMPFGAPALDLFSSGDTNINLNALVTSGWITGRTNEAIIAGSQPSVSPSGQTNGRTFFYIDDESVKLPINYAIGERSSLNPSLPRPYSFESLRSATNITAANFDKIIERLAFVITNTNSINNKSASTWSYFFTPEQAIPVLMSSNNTNNSPPLFGPSRAGPAQSARLVAQLTTAKDTNAATTPWGTPRVAINRLDLVDGSIDTIVQALTNTRLTAIFGGHFGNKYGEAGVRQLAANMLQLRSDHWAGGANFDGANVVLGTDALKEIGLTAGAAAGIGKKTHGIPPTEFGYVPFPMIEHVAVGAIHGWTAPGVMSVMVVVECQLFNPYPVGFPGGGRIYAQIDKARGPMSYGQEQWRGPEGTPASEAPHNNYAGASDAWGSPDAANPDAAANRTLNPINGVQSAPLPEIGPNGRETVLLPFTFSFDEGDNTAGIGNIFCIIDNIRLLADESDPASIRDWCSGNDFFNALTTGGAAGPAQFQLPMTGDRGPFGDALVGEYVLTPELAPPPTQKLVRLDPRMRPSLAISEIYQSEPPGRAWRLVNYGAAPPGPRAFGNQVVSVDPAYPNDLAMAIFNTNLPPVLVGSGVYTMAADLGKVFTGLPWRTLRIQPQPSSEAASPSPLIPDWVMLDIIDYRLAGQTLTTVNPNIRYASGDGTTLVGFGAGIRSQLDVLTNSVSITKIIDPITEQVITNANFPAAIAIGNNLTNLLTALSSLDDGDSNWAIRGKDSWSERRRGRGFPDNALLLASEIAEVNGFANYITGNPNNFKANEYRLGALFPGLSAKSRFFKIYAVGEALAGTNGDSAAVALLQTLVEVNDSTSPPSISIIHQYPPAN